MHKVRERPRTEAQQTPEVTVSGVSLCTGEPNHPGLPHTEPQPCFVRNDLGNDWLKQLSNDDKLWLLTNAFLDLMQVLNMSKYLYVPKLEYGKNRSFQQILRSGCFPGCAILSLWILCQLHPIC